LYLFLVFGMLYVRVFSVVCIVMSRKPILLFCFFYGNL
jgi:hypothetical protein